MLLLLVLYLFLLIINKKNAIVSFLIIVQIACIAAGYFIGLSFEIESIKDILVIIFIVLCNYLVISPWSRAYVICDIRSNEKKVEALSKILISVSAIVFVILFVASIVIIIFTRNNIEIFKDNNTEFYYNYLPFNVYFYILAIYLYNYSYFLIPLHFYYLYKNNYKKAIICVILSANILLYGATFFSRWTIVHYFLLYFMFFLLCKKLISLKVSTRIKQIGVLLTTIFLILFLSISFSRFEDNKSYSDNIPSSSIIQNTTLYSLVDYLGQSSMYGPTLISAYRGKNMKGELALSTVKDFLNVIGIISYDRDKVNREKELLWGYNKDKFNGLIAYSVYDFGLFFTILIFMIYNFYVKINIKKVIDLEELFILTILIQLPLFSIFYSVISTMLFLFVSYLPIHIYLKFSFVNVLSNNDNK